MKYNKLLISPDTTIKSALKVMDAAGHKIVIIINNENQISGVVTDGDFRRWVLNNGSLDERIEKVMNSNPIVLHEGYNSEEAKNIMATELIEAIPVINSNNEVVSVCFWHEFFEKKMNHYAKINIPVVIMAGGKGTRLYPYTKILPKPLIPIGEKPIAELIISRFEEYGCKEFYMSVNYKANMIKAYFNDIPRSYTIKYIEEEKPLGTCGSLYILRNELQGTFFLSNCDILVEANYSDILKYHREKGNKITLITAMKNYTIPYGVIHLNNDGTVDNIAEKPEFNFLVNTGMYIMEPDVIDLIPANQFFDIPDLISLFIKNNEKVGVYPVSEKSWLDMGQLEEMQEMMKRLGV